jgi:transposase
VTLTRDESLPHDIDALLAIVLKERAERVELIAQVATLEHQLRVYARWIYGPRSEKRVIEFAATGPQALLDFMLPREEAQRLADQTGAQGTVTIALPAEPSARRKSAPRRTEFPEHLPQVRTEVEIAEAERQCCGRAMEPMGHEVTKVLERVETSLVHEIARVKYCCRVCQMNVLTAPLPTRGLDRTLLGNSFLVSAAIERFQHHMPYHRLEQKYKGEGLDLSRSVLCRSMTALSERFEPVMEPLREEVLSEGVLFADETGVVFQAAPSTDERADGWMWLYANKGGDYYFDINESRGKDSPAKMLAKYAGFLHADGYGVYPSVIDPTQVQIVACWAHARRGFVDAGGSERRLADEAIDKIGKLFELEKLGVGSEVEELRKLRAERAPPLLDDFRAWCETTLPKLLPRGPLAGAIGYCLNRWGDLVRYVSDGRLELTNNRSERAIRPFAVGRKNWMFVGNERGGRAAAIFYSLLSTCRARGIDPRSYLLDAMLRLAEGGDPATLTPCEWQRRFAAEFDERRRYVAASVLVQLGR